MMSLLQVINISVFSLGKLARMQTKRESAAALGLLNPPLDLAFSKYI